MSTLGWLKNIKSYISFIGIINYEIKAEKTGSIRSIWKQNKDNSLKIIFMEIIFEININDKVGKRVQNNQWEYPKEKVLLWIDRANHRNGEKTYAP